MLFIASSSGSYAVAATDNGNDDITSYLLHSQPELTYKRSNRWRSGISAMFGNVDVSVDDYYLSFENV